MLYVSSWGQRCSEGPRSPTLIRVRSVVVPGSRRDSETARQRDRSTAQAGAHVFAGNLQNLIQSRHVCQHPDKLGEVPEQTGEIDAVDRRRWTMPAISHWPLPVGAIRPGVLGRAWLLWARFRSTG